MMRRQRSDHMNSAKSYKYHLGSLAILANPLDAFVYRFVCIFSLGFVVCGLYMEPKSVVLWLLFLIVLTFSWRVSTYALLPVKLLGVEAELCFTDQIIGLETGTSYYYVQRKGALVKKGLFSTNIIKGASGGLLLVNAKAVPLEVIKAAIQKA